MCLDQLNSPDISALQFADDILLISKNLDLNTCIRNIEIAAQRAYETIQHMGLQISTEKTKAIIFTKGKIRNIPNTIKINNAPIEWMSWTKHIESCVTKAARGTNVMKSLTKVWWGSDPKTLLNIYKGIVRTHLDFDAVRFQDITGKLEQTE
nr:unnamed protein product [Callosobruchus analis]